MNQKKIPFLIIFSFFILLSIITFRCALPSDMVFSGDDLNIGRLASKKHALPEMLTGYFTGNQIMGSSTYGFTLFHVLLSILPLNVFADLFYPFVLICGSLSMVWFLRIWNCSWYASVCGALVSFWFNSITLASSGHAYKMEVLVLSVLSLALIEKSVRAISWKGILAYGLFSGLAVGIMMVEQQDVALLAGLFIAFYVLIRILHRFSKEWKKGLLLIIPLMVISLSISGNTILKSYQQNITNASNIQSNPVEKWNYVTQWSMVPNEIPDLIAPGWSGIDSENRESPYWGKIGQSADFEITQKGISNFKLDSIYIGILPFALSTFALVIGFRNRKNEEGKVIIFFGVASIIALFLSFGKYSLLYEFFYKLPLVSNIRAPIKFLDNMQIFMGIISAFALSNIIQSKVSKKFIVRSIIILGVLLSILLITAFNLKYFVSNSFLAECLVRCSSNGIFAEESMIINQMSNAWLHSSIIILTFILILCTILIKQIRFAGISLIILFATDSILLTNNFFKGEDISKLKKGNSVLNYLKKNNGNNRILFLDQTGHYHNWIAMDAPYYDLDVFNIWQMPRISNEYNEYLAMQAINPIRLWEISSVKFITGSPSFNIEYNNNPYLKSKINPVISYSILIDKGERIDSIYTLKTSIPRFAIYYNWTSMDYNKHIPTLMLPEYNPLQNALVDTDYVQIKNKINQNCKEVKADINKKRAIISINEDSEVLLRFSQRFQPGWKVTINGKETELLRVDYLSMGVIIPAGKNEVIFSAVSGIKPVVFSSSCFLIAIIFGFYLLKLENKND